METSDAGMATSPSWATELIRRIGEGDDRAEAELAQRYDRPLLFLLRRLTGDPALADDLRQETLRVVLEKAREGQIAEPERLAGFLRSTAKNLWFNEGRKEKRRRSEALDAVAEPVDPSPNQLARVLREEDKRRIRQVLSELDSDRDRQILYRVHLAGDEKEDICRDLELGSLQFNLVLHRARQRFKKLLGARSEIDGRLATQGRKGLP